MAKQIGGLERVGLTQRIPASFRSYHVLSHGEVRRMAEVALL